MTRLHPLAILALLVFAVLTTLFNPSISDLPVAHADTLSLAPTGTFFLSAERNGRWEIYAAHADGAWGEITREFSPARAPALSPAGKQLAFQSHRDGNWEIFVLRLDSGQVSRLTQQLAYDGAPAWSPDEKQIAFESYHSGHLDIWVMNADGSNPVNLTSNEPAYDYGPAWSPQGNWIAYTSWSAGHRQIFLTSPDAKSHLNLSNNQFDEEQPAWSPDGRRLAFVSNREGCEHESNVIQLNACQRREIFIADFDGLHLSNVRQLTFDGRATAPVWSPDGQSVAYVSPRPDRQVLYVIPATGGIPHAVNTPSLWVGSAAWSSSELALHAPANNDPPLYVEKPIAAPADAGHPYETQELKQIYLAPSWGQMSSRVANSFLTLRARVKEESGYDFLNTLADMTRDITSTCDKSCDNLSWHKSGRAVDAQLEYTDRSGQDLLALVREDQLGETYWRLYLRASVQDGTLGEPLKAGVWDLSYRARAVIAPDLGGIENPPPSGYYIDFTELAREYGWNRISSHDDPDFDWRWYKLALEYWHYQKTDGLPWYQAMKELYAPSQLESSFEWNRVQRVWGVEEMRLFFKQIPAPPSAWKWFALIPESSQ